MGVMDGPFRGFVELPRAVFESLREVGETVLAEAVRKATPPAVPARHTGWILTGSVERAMFEYIAERGFERLQTERALMEPVVSFYGRHRCGAWAASAVSERALLSQRDAADAVFDALDRLECCCVPRRTD